MRYHALPSTAMRPAGHERSANTGTRENKPQQDRRRAGNRLGSPLALGFRAQRGPRFLKGDLDRPAPHDPVQELLWGGVQVGTEEGGLRQFAFRIAHQNKAHGYRGHARGILQRGARENPEPFALAPLPVHPRLWPWRVRAGGPDLQTPLPRPFGGLPSSCTGQWRAGQLIERRI